MAALGVPPWAGLRAQVLEEELPAQVPEEEAPAQVLEEEVSEEGLEEEVREEVPGAQEEELAQA